LLYELPEMIAKMSGIREEWRESACIEKTRSNEETGI
jgi:hypothetical protein